MNKNNQCFKLFKQMKEGYENKNMDQVSHAARCWLELNPENPFPADSPEMEAFFQMQKCFTICKRGDIDRKINGRKMIMWAEELCKLNPKQPYKYDKKAEEEELRLAAEKALQEQKEKIEQHKEIVESTKNDNLVHVKPKEVEEEQREEKRNWFKFLFPWKKEGVSNDSTGSN